MNFKTWLIGSDDGFTLPLVKRARWAVEVRARRALRRLHPANASCNNPNCEYRGRRTRHGIWCPACYDDGGGELILDPEPGGSES